MSAQVDDQRIRRMERRDGALLRKVGDVIAAEPERYDQFMWAQKRDCGTTCCLAGQTVSLLPEFEGFDFAPCCAMTGQAFIAGESRNLVVVAQNRLGITDAEAGWLFGANWKPVGDPATPLHERVRDALYALADGATVEEVSA